MDKLNVDKPMDLELVKWLNLVWGALEEVDSDKRADMLDHAHSVLEQTRGLVPETAEIPRS